MVEHRTAAPHISESHISESHVSEPLDAVIAFAPSNIALIKYWGKSDPDQNWPANDSLSMTLNRAATRTIARINRAANDSADHQLGFGETFTNNLRVRDMTKPKKFLEQLRVELKPWLRHDGALEIVTTNSFPSACGIASSASGYAALTVAAAGAWTGQTSIEGLAGIGISKDKLANWARQGSGSACRSMHGGFVRWVRGETAGQQVCEQIFDEHHWPLADLIVVLDSKQKQVSSTEGHSRAFSSPLMNIRLAGLEERLKCASAAIRNKDLEQLGQIIEAEALEMHAVMMTANPPTQYFSQGTVRFIAWLRQARATGSIAAWFTLDAGPNPHLICRPEDSLQIAEKIRGAFPDARIIMDSTGSGVSMPRWTGEDRGGVAHGH